MIEIDIYDPIEAAKLEAYLDIQSDIEHEDFALPLEADILDYLNNHIYNK